MKVKQEKVRKFLSKQIQELNDIVETMEDVVPILKNEIHSFYKK